MSKFKASKYQVTSIDFKVNDEASDNIVLVKGQDFSASSLHILSSVASSLNGDKYDAVFTVAGGSYFKTYLGWAGGNLLDPDFLASVDAMFGQSVQSSAISATVAALHLKEGGLLQLTGASAATDGTPGMIGYGMAKAAVHQLVRSCAGPNSGLPVGSKALAILPVIIDTPMNRKFMPDADFGSWTPLDDICHKLEAWTNGSEPVQSGAIFRVVTEQFKTSFTPVL